MRPAPPSTVSAHHVASQVGQGLRGQPPPPPPPPPGQWHPSQKQQQQQQPMQQDGAAVYEQQVEEPFGGYTVPHFGAHTQQHAQQQQQQMASPVYSSTAFPSSPVSPFSSSTSAFDFAGPFGYGGLSTQQQQQQQVIQRQHAHTPLGHVHAQSFRSPHQQMSHHGPSFTTARHVHHPHHGHSGSPSGSDSPVLSEIGGGGSGGSVSGASTSWHTPSPRLHGLGVLGNVGGVGGAAGLGSNSGSMCVGGVGGSGESEEDLSGYMPMPPLRYSPDADLDFPPSASSSNSSTTNNAMALANAHDDMRMMSIGHAHSTSSGTDGLARFSHHINYPHSHGHPLSNNNHNNNDLTFIATTLNPDFISSSPGSLTPSLGDNDAAYTSAAALHPRNRSRSTSSNPPFRRRPIQLPQLNVPATVDLSTGGATDFVESNPALDTDMGDEDGLGGGGRAGTRKVALAPLHLLQRNHPYRRNPSDDRQLRMLGWAVGDL
jgi:hypothetical protein